MRCREKRIRIGQTVTLKNAVNSYWLPDGLRDGMTAIVKGSGYGTLVVEQSGTEWRISDRCVEHEMEFEIGHRWLPANDPRVAAAMEKEGIKNRLDASEFSSALTVHGNVLQANSSKSKPLKVFVVGHVNSA